MVERQFRSVVNVSSRSMPKIWVWALLVFALLAVRFTPNWLVFAREYRGAMAQAPDAAHRAVVAESFLNTIPAARGVFVARQAANLSARLRSRSRPNRNAYSTASPR